MGAVGPGKRQIGLSVSVEAADWLRIEAAGRRVSQGELVEAALVLLRESLGDSDGATAHARRLVAGLTRIEVSADAVREAVEAVRAELAVYVA